MLTLLAFQLGQIRTAPKYDYSEPKPGYLSKFAWKTDPGVVTNLRAGDNPVVESVVTAMKANNIPGAAVVVIKNNKIILEAGFGTSNVKTGRQFTATTPSRCGSISKTATALSILRATEIGPFKLDDHVVDYLSTPSGINKIAGKDKANWSTLKIRDLLDHRSGIDGSIPYLTSKALHDAWSVTGTMNRAQLIYGLRKNYDLKPAGSYTYHNLNFEIASQLLEDTTQKPFGEALDWLLCKPLGIPSDQLFLSPTYHQNNVPTELPKGEARCYQFRSDLLEDYRHQGNKTPEAYGGLNGDVLSGAGHIAFSAKAIAQIVIALRTQPKAFMSQKSWDEITTAPKGAPSDGYYSKGTIINKVGGNLCYNHGAMLMHAGGQYNWVDKDTQFVVIANSNSPSGQLVDVILATAVRKELQTWPK